MVMYQIYEMVAFGNLSGKKAMVQVEMFV